MNTLLLRDGGRRGSALLITLAFLLLLTVLVVGFIARSVLEVQLSTGSASQSKVDLAAQGAAAAVIADLQAEIVAGSVAPTTTPPVYLPTSNLTMIPSYGIGFTPGTGLENLLKISKYSYPFWSASITSGGPMRAANVPTTTPSLNYRSISIPRWNKALMMNPKSATDYTPSSGNFVVPDWIYVARDGSNPQALTAGASTVGGTNPISQRYAYAIYDEGSTLDMNVAGSPVTGTTPTGLTYTTLQPYKNALAYADLSQLPPLTALSTTQQMNVINAIVGWRNYATSQASGTFPSYTFPPVTSATLPPFDSFIASNPGGFLSVGSSTLASSTTGLATGPNGPQSDNALASRQQLIQFLMQGLSSMGLQSTFVNLLQYMGTFTRDINQPSYAPVPAKTSPDATHRPAITALTNGGNNATGGDVQSPETTNINPPFLEVYPSAAYTRADGSTASTTEPLVKKRFALNRLCWLTYKGPSSQRTQFAVGSTTPGLSSPDYDMWAMVNLYGVAPALLQQGTTTAIESYFGLDWVQDTSTAVGINDSTYKWKYVHGANVHGAGVGSSTPGHILTLSQVSQLSPGRDADFFELLKATICTGALAKPGTQYFPQPPPSSVEPLIPDAYQYFRDQSIDIAIIQIGANIIDQSKVDGFCTRIIFDDGSWAVPQEYRGVQDLPYIYKIQNADVRVQDGKTSVSGTGYPANHTASTTDMVTQQGLSAFLEEPVVWNPHTWNPTKPVATQIRPTKFRTIMVSGDPNNFNSPTSPGTIMQGSTVGTNGTSPVSDTATAAPPGPLPKSPVIYAMSASTGAMTFTSAMTFDLPSTRLDLFREPTMLCKPSVPMGCNLAIDATSPGTADFMLNDPAVSSYVSGGYLTAAHGYFGYFSQLQPLTDDLHYVGFYMGCVPVVFPYTTGYTASMFATPTGNQNFTFRMQYQDPSSSKWVTYDEKYSTLCYLTGTNTNGWIPNCFLNNSRSSTDMGDFSINVFYDPRTSHFGFQHNWSAWYQNTIEGNPPGEDSYFNWTCGGQNVLQSQRPDRGFGYLTALDNYFLNVGVYLNETNPVFASGQRVSPLMGASEQNDPYAYFNINSSSSRYVIAGAGAGGIVGTDFITDPDGVCRRAMAAWTPFTFTSGTPGSSTAGTYVASGTNMGLPMAMATTYTPAMAANFTTAQIGTPNSNSFSRPVMLNRPFRSVGELGYVFSDTPWKNLDFSTPESGYSALLDVFCINDTPDPNGLVAGKVNLNSRQSAVLQAVLGGAYKEEYYSSATATFNTTSSAPLSTTEVTSIVSDATNGLVQRTSSTAAGKGPLENVSDLVGRWVSPQLIPGGLGVTIVSPHNIDGGGNLANPTANPGSYQGFSGDLGKLSIMMANPSTTTAPLAGQRYRESVIRALSSTTTTRVWNLMIDLIAQSGRFPSSASSLANFSVEGERRYWVHVAIDRITGKVIDEQIEEVKE